MLKVDNNITSEGGKEVFRKLERNYVLHTINLSGMYLNRIRQKILIKKS